MKRILITLTIAVLGLFTANAEERTKVYQFGDITKIEAGFMYDLHVTEGKSSEVTVVYDDKYERHMRVNFNQYESKLTLELNDIPKVFKQMNGGQPHIHVYIEMDHIDSIVLMGASTADFNGKFSSDNVDIRMNGATKLNSLNITGKNLSLSTSGAGKVEIYGTFSRSVEMDLSGAANTFLKIDTPELEGELSGASNVIYEGKATICDLECSGAASIDMKGEADKVYFEGSGACSIDARDFVAEYVDLTLSGASKAKVNATKLIRHDISRACKMTYYGDAELENISEDSNIVRGR
jgi:hypothetical protein